nr:MAG TPA: hypothetical protein [Caudoviricetes sp.]
MRRWRVVADVPLGRLDKGLSCACVGRWHGRRCGR